MLTPLLIAGGIVGIGLVPVLLASGRNASSRNGDQGGGVTSSRVDDVTDGVDSAETDDYPSTPPNDGLGTHKSGDPYGSFRAINLADWKASNAVGEFVNGALRFFGIPADVTSDRMPAPVLFVHPDWATAALFHQHTVSVDTGAGVGVDVSDGAKRGFYKGVAGFYPSGSIDVARGRELYGDLEKAAKKGAYMKNDNGRPVLAYRTKQWS